MAEVRWTEEASTWLQNIYEYIAENDQRAAQKVVNEIYEQTQLLLNYPKLGYKYKDVLEGEIRILLYGHYRIAYLIKHSIVEIIGIFHGALQMENYLQE